MLAAILGAGPIADAFFVALRLPNHFRAIFAEGAFNAAFVPAYARVREQEGAATAQIFSSRIFTVLVAVEIVLVAAAMIFTPAVISLLAPGFSDDPSRFALASELTRITFPYLLLVSLVTVYGGILNTLGYFASPAAAPILLNLSMMMTLALAAFFPTAGHAAAWGVLIAGFLEALLVGADAARRGVLPTFAAFKLDDDIKKFFKALGPATLGSAGTQIALFADTIIASFLTAGAISALYYADRLNQLPIGVIGIAIGTVLLPEMAQPHRARRCFRVAICAEPRDRTHAAAVDAVSRRFRAGAGPDHARAVRARCVHRRRCGRIGGDARGLRDRASAVCPAAQRHRDLPCARRYGDAGQGVVRVGRRQRRAEDCADGSLCADRPGVRHVRRCVDQFPAAAVVRATCRIARVR